MEEHIRELVEKYNVGFISVQDENFGARKDHTYAFADLMHKYDLIWQASGIRCTNVSPDDIKYYKERGCASFKFGIETGSQKILDVMEKNFNVSDVVSAVTSCWDHEMYSPLAFMVGMPGETGETITETGEFLGKMAYHLGISPNQMDNAIFYAIPFPGTPLYNFIQQVGLVGHNLNEEEEYLLKLADLRTNKWDYLNLNGARAKEILSWDLLVRLEAGRIYSRLQKQNPRPPTKFAEKWREKSHWGKDRTRIVNAKTLLLRFEEFLYDHVFTGFATNLFPRYFAHWLVKNIYFFDIWCHYKIRKIFRLDHGSSFNFYRDKKPTKTFSELEELFGDSRLERSLRHIVADGEDALYDERGEANDRLLKGAVG